MKQGSTIFLRLAVLVIGAGVLAVCIFALPHAIRSELAGDFDYAPILLGIYVTAIPFFFALYQTLKLLHYIDTNKAFSELSVKALRYIKYCALTIGGLFAVGLPYIFYLADQEDAPGVFAIGLIFAGASFVVATFAAVLQKLLRNAIAIKSENDLTV